MSDTPLTDAEQDDARNVALEFNCRNPEPLPGENCYVVSADFARELERELLVAKSEVESFRKAMRISPSLAALEALRHDIEAYRGALGYSVSADHNGKLTDGTTPVCGLCHSEYTRKAKNFYEAVKKLLTNC